MENIQKCRLLPVLVFLLCRSNVADGFSFQPQSSGYYGNDYSSKYQASNGGYDDSRGFGSSGSGKNQQILSSFGNGKPSFATSNGQNGYDRESGVVKEESYDSSWNRGSGFSQSKPGFATELKKEWGNPFSSSSNSNWGSGSETVGNSEKQGNSGSGINSGWNSGFQNVEPKTEGYAFSSGKKNSNNQQNGNFNRPSNSGSGSMSSFQKKANSGSGLNSGWNSGFQNVEPNTEGYVFSSGKKTADNQQNGSFNRPSSSGSGSMSSFEKKANTGSGLNSGWNSGFQNVEPNTEGYVFSSGKKNSDNQQNGNFNRPPSSGSGSKKNQGKPSNGNFGQTPGYENEESKTEGYGSYSQSKEISGNQWNTNSDGLSFVSSPEKKQGSGKDTWAFNDGDSNSEPSSSWNKKKTGKPGAGSNYWGPKPEKSDPKQPQKGYSPQGSNKPVANKPSSGKKTEPIDWDTLEKETRGGGALDIDVSQLWYPNGRGNPYGSGTVRQTRKRNVGADAGECYCTEFADCDSEGIVDIMDAFRSGYFHLREKVAECAMRNKICCRTRRAPIRNVVAENGNEVGKYQNRGINQRPTCGKRVSKLAENDMSTEGLANYGDFPWILRMIASGDDGGETLCSAALIHNSVALTTASCALLLTGEEIRARAGEWNSVEGNSRNKIQEAKIGKIFLHPQFDFVEYTNDLALVFLEEPLDPGLGVNSVCLPSPNDVWDSSRCVTAGWIREDGQGVEEPMLAEIELNDVTEGKCRNNSEPVGYEMETNDPGYVCAHSRNVNPCVADSGALLMCPLINSDMQVLIGFLSQKAICNEFYKTAAYANILESMAWISHMEGMYLYFNNVGLVH